ncbi:MAG: asparaginase [Candidatus Neomarinimicrobiota bacterium]
MSYADHKVESIHLSSAGGGGPDGNVAFAAGFIATPTYICSAAKPYQAVTLHTSGSYQKYHLTPEDLALPALPIVVSRVIWRPWAGSRNGVVLNRISCNAAPISQ